MILVIAVLLMALLLVSVTAYVFYSKCYEQKQQAIIDLPLDPVSEEPETGNFVRRKTYKRATPETYRNLFDLDADGQRVLEHLTTVFCRDAFASTDRETNYRLGQHSVINFIINNINQANHPNYKEEVND